MSAWAQRSVRETLTRFAIYVALAGLLAGCGNASDDEVPAAAATVAPAGIPVSFSMASGSPGETIPPGSPDAVPPTVGDLVLDGVAPASVPIVISEHLNTIQLAVRNTVSDDVFTGSQLVDSDTDAVTMIVYGTDSDEIESVLDDIAADVRDRISVVQSAYSANDLREATARLDAAGIAVVWLMPRFEQDVVEVFLESPDGTPDPEIEAMAIQALGDLPAIISFSPPPHKLNVTFPLDT